MWRPCAKPCCGSAKTRSGKSMTKSSRRNCQNNTRSSVGTRRTSCALTSRRRPRATSPELQSAHSSPLCRLLCKFIQSYIKKCKFVTLFFLDFKKITFFIKKRHPAFDSQTVRFFFSDHSDPKEEASRIDPHIYLQYFLFIFDLQ